MTAGGPRPRIVHLMRAPVVGGSELETLTIVRTLRRYAHEVLYPAAFRDFEPSIADRFPRDVPVVACDDLEGRLHADPPAIAHIQFPFLVDRNAGHHPSTLIFKGLHDFPPCPVVFTVHAAVNVPVLPRITYVFHTAELRGRFPMIPDDRVAVLPSLVEPPPSVPARPAKARIRILAVSRDEDAKFHPRLADICTRARALCPEIEFRFVGTAPSRQPAPGPHVSIVPCPAEDLEREYAEADVFWHFPDPGLEETWCRTVTEAMSRELPCVVAAHGAMKEQVRDGIDGRVVPDTDSCVAALTELARDPDFRYRAGRGAAARAAEFRTAAAEGLDALYTRLIRGPAAPSDL